MDFLIVFVAFIALFTALQARRGFQSLTRQLEAALRRLSRLESLLPEATAGHGAPGEAVTGPAGAPGAIAGPPPAAAPGPPPSGVATDAGRGAAPAPVPGAAALPADPASQQAASAAQAGGAPPAGVGEGAHAAAGAPSRRPARASLEERLGTRWTVLAGGVSLALGGLLLVRFSIEQGVFGPPMRVALGALFALALIAAGEWFRRSEAGLPIEVLPAAHVPSVLTAAGTASAFGTVYAAHALYGYLGPLAAFILLGIIGVATMLAAALHGPALAGLGLAASLAVPLLVSAEAPSPWPLVVYLAAVACAAYALARLRRWLWLAAAVVVGALLWGLAFIGQFDDGGGVDWMNALFVHTGLQLALAAVFMALEPHLATADAAATPDWDATAALGALTLLAVLALAVGRLEGQAIAFAMCAMLILALTSWRSAPAAGAAPLAGLVSLGAIAAWPGLAALPEPRLLAPAVAEVLRIPDNVSQFLIFAFVSALAIGLLATLRLERGRALPEPAAGLYALGAIAPSLLALILAYLRVTQFDRSIPFAGFAIVLAADFYLAAHRYVRLAEAQRTAATRLAAGAFAAGVAGAVTLACVMALERGYLTVAFAITAFATAIVAHRQRISMLRGVVAALAVVVLLRLLYDPRIMGASVGSMPIFNWLLLGYGVPAVAFLGAGFVLKGEREDLPVRVCDALGIVFAALLVFYEIRHALNGGDPLANTSGHVEQGLYALMSLCFAYVLMRLDAAAANPVFRVFSLVFGILSALVIVLGLGIVENPLLNSDRILGVPVFSSLLLAYLLPGAAAAVLARAARGLRPAWYVRGAAILATLLVFGYVTLEVRHLFVGDVIAVWKPASQPEIWAYSAAWLGLGLVLLAYGITRGTREPRLASAALVMLAVIKVLLYDLTGIGGLWRAFSVILLGAVLMGIGLAYQKLVFARTPPAPRG